MSVPKSISELSLIIGPEAAYQVWRCYTGTNLYIPRFDTAERIERDKRIVQLHQQGVTRSDLAEMFNLSERQIWRITRNENQEPAETRSQQQEAERQPTVAA